MTGLSERVKNRVLRLHGLCMAVLVAILLSGPVQAVNHESVSARNEPLLKVGRHAGSDKEVKPAQMPEGDSAQLKFVQCVQQAQQDAPKKSIACFQRLIQEYPELPEAYNNIGVLYAGMGMHVEARKWFERGLTQQKAYATLHQNLLNLQSEINRSAYAAALQLDISKNNVQPKLGLLAKITSLPQAASTTDSLVTGPATRKPTQPLAAVPESVVVKEKAVEKPALKIAQEPAVPSATPVDSTQQSRVRETVLAWALAWSKKDMPAYLKAYAPSFSPEGNLSRSAWEEQRRLRIMAKKQIHVELSELKISYSNAKATATFIQSYESGAILTHSRKTLELTEEKGQWVITREFVSGS
jgi:tetratricopeptide (TPR) repeat protein